MKVYFVGAHSTGKTTLARYVSKQYSIPMITEVARMVLSENESHLDSLRYDMDAIDKYQKDVFQRQLVEEGKHPSFVSDRSFDNLAYAAQHTRLLSKLLVTPEVSQYSLSLKAPDVFVFFVRPSRATLKADGVREAINWDGVVAIDAMVKFMLEMWDIKYFQIPVDNMQERIRLVENILGLHKP